MSGPKSPRGATTKKKQSIPVEWHDDKPFVIATEEFNHAALDSPSDLVREGLKAGRPLEEIIEELLEERARPMAAEVLNRMIEFIITAENARLAAYQVALAGGLGVILGITGPKVAEMFGITKQAVQQGVDRFCEEVGLRKTRAMRDEEARENMSQSHYAPPKGELL